MRKGNYDGNVNLKYPINICCFFACAAKGQVQTEARRKEAIDAIWAIINLFKDFGTKPEVRSDLARIFGEELSSNQLKASGEAAGLFETLKKQLKGLEKRIKNLGDKNPITQAEADDYFNRIIDPIRSVIAKEYMFAEVEERELVHA